MYDHLPGTGFWLTMLILAALGLLSAIGGLLFVVVWAVHHIRIQ